MEEYKKTLNKPATTTTPFSRSRPPSVIHFSSFKIQFTQHHHQPHKASPSPFLFHNQFTIGHTNHSHKIQFTQNLPLIFTRSDTKRRLLLIFSRHSLEYSLQSTSPPLTRLFLVSIYSSSVVDFEYGES